MILPGIQPFQVGSSVVFPTFTQQGQAFYVGWLRYIHRDDMPWLRETRSLGHATPQLACRFLVTCLAAAVNSCRSSQVSALCLSCRLNLFYGLPLEAEPTRVLSWMHPYPPLTDTRFMLVLFRASGPGGAGPGAEPKAEVVRVGWYCTSVLQRKVFMVRVFGERFSSRDEPSSVCIHRVAGRFHRVGTK